MFILFLGSATAWAQNENINWMFGHHTRLNFSSSPPVISESNMQCWEGGSVCFSDGVGNLMFYSNGNQVWNANGNVMPNGNNILGNGPTATLPYGYPCSSAQGAMAVQSIRNNSQYYLFVLDAMEDGPPWALGRLRYSVIDMTLNGGLGDVVASQKNIILDDSMTEKMTVIKADGCGFWLVTHKMYTNNYSAFKIDAGGISTTPVISSGQIPGELGYGMLNASSDGKILVMTSAAPGVEISNFNNVTGTISNAGYFTTPGGKLGACISPDNTKLYVGHYNKLSQYDLSSFPNVATVLASEQIISTSITYGQMRRGPDGKIYVANVNTDNMAIIKDPNNSGLACNYELYGMMRPAFAQFPPIPPNTTPGQYGSGLGQEVMPATNMIQHMVRSVIDTTLCAGAPIVLSVADDADYYLWNTEDSTSSLTINTPGTYWVKSFINCDAYVDTFHVSSTGYEDWNLGNDTAICPQSSIILDAFRPEITTCTWQNGSQATAINVSEAGKYWATVMYNNCSLSDTIEVSVMTPFVRIMERDTAICAGAEVILHAMAFPESFFLWGSGGVGPALTTNKAGTYVVYAGNVCGTFTDSIQVEAKICDCKILVPTAFSPNGDGENDRYMIPMECSKLASFELRIFNRYGQPVFQTNDSKQGWNGFFKGKPADIGSYFFMLMYSTEDGNLVKQKGSIDLVR
jgi:gliding motility-associated-like protein